MRHELTGTVAAQGMTIGRARHVASSHIEVDTRPLEADAIEPELARLHAALAQAQADLTQLQHKLQRKFAEQTADFVHAHSLLLNDPELIRGLETMIREQHLRAGVALKAQRDRLVDMFQRMDDPYLRSRSEDIEQVIGRVLNILERSDTKEERKLAARVGEILVARTLAPSDLASMVEHGLLGAITMLGNRYSHSAILARNLSVPMLTGVTNAQEKIRDNDLILLDAVHGRIVVHPDSQDLAYYRAWQRRVSRRGRRLRVFADRPTRTHDHSRAYLWANAEQTPDLALARAHGAAGVGLYRSEFLFLHQMTLPSEDQQFQAYRQLVLAMDGLPVTIRLLDLGADKAGELGLDLEHEDNPALGVRGVRLLLRHPNLLATQLRAILRAAVYGPIRLLVPMVTQGSELVAVRTMLGQCVENLREAAHTVPERLDVGAMIEVPAAAMMTASLARQADFLALGTNDLAQYLLASDRNNHALEALYSPLQPALLRLIHQVIHDGRRAGVTVSLCGEMASDPQLVPLLLALGLEHFSVHPQQILPLREHIARFDHYKLMQQTPAILAATSLDAIQTCLERLHAEALHASDSNDA